MNFRKDYFSFFLLFSSFIFFAVLAFISEGSWGGADNVVHYRIAHYAFKYPHLFLDLWGKPLFTILSSPFAQFGYVYMKFFNVVVAISTAFFSWRILKILHDENAFVVIPAILFAPVYFILIPSAMTELLFGLILVLSIYFFFKDKFLISAIVISFLPFARNEGFVIMPLFFIAYLLKRDIKAIPFMLTGFVFFSFLGWKHFGKLFWILNNNPYTGASQIYGSGKLFHFVEKSPEIFGIPLLVLFLIGLIFSLKNVFKEKFKLTQSFYFILLIVFSALIYFAAHSYVWWKGMGGSLGLTRVMAGIVPLFAIIAAYAINNIPGKNWFRNTFAIIAVIFIIYVPFSQYKVPLEIDDTEKLIKETSNWIIDEGLDKRLVFYYDPMFCHYLKLDPFDSEKAREQIGNHESPEETVPSGAIVIWDGHFGPNEGGMLIEKLKQNPAFKLIWHVEPEHEITVLNGHKYEIFVFERI